MYVPADDVRECRVVNLIDIRGRVGWRVEEEVDDFLGGEVSVHFLHVRILVVQRAFIVPGTRGAPQYLAQRAEPLRAFLRRLQRHGEELDDVRWGHLLEGSVYRLLQFAAVTGAGFGDEDRGRDVEELASFTDARRRGGECVVRELAVRERGGQRDVSPGASNAGNDR